MTVTYTAEVATCTGLGCFWKLLFRWHGSIYKLLWPNLIVYSIIYFSLSFIYRFVLDEEYRVLFEKITLYCQAYGDLIPIAFVLGFYVSIVIKRWWDQYICMPWPDNLAMFVSTLIHGQDDRGRLMRRTIIRYVNLCLVITLRMMSPPVKKRFPTLDHLVEAGFLQPNEKKIFEDLETKTSHPKYWMPLVWAGGIVTRARKEGRIKDDFGLKTLIDGLNAFRSGCGGMLNYDWISIPLVYTQVVTLAVYTYFMATLMGNQFLDPLKGYPNHDVDLVVPIFTFLQFFFYMGWLKVAESLVNPFGEDDDDFELNWLVDRNLQVSYVIVDEMHQEHPEMVKDQYWDEVFPAELPYTVASKLYQTGPPPGSADNVEVSIEQAEFIPMETVQEDAQEEVDDLGDIEIDVEDAESGGTRKETHPMTIKNKQKIRSSGSINTGSYSVNRSGRKGSVLNMLTKIFRREGSSRDLAGSNMGSSISLPSRRGVRSSSRMSSMSQAQSRTSIPRINTFQDEVFHMSDLSLTDSALTSESPIQITVLKVNDSKQQNVTTEDTEVAETQQLIASNKEDTTRKVSKRKLKKADSKVVEIQNDNASDASGNSVQTIFFQESWDNSVDPSETAFCPSPQQKLSDVPKQTASKSKKSELKDMGTISPFITFTDTCVTTEAPGSATQIVLPSSTPIKHMFAPLVYQDVPIQKEEKKKYSGVKDDLLHQTSSLSRSLQQEYLGKEISARSTIQIPNSYEEHDMAAKQNVIVLTSDPKSNADSQTVFTILSPAAQFSHKAYEILPVTPAVSLPSVIVPTTSVITMTSSGMSAVTVTPSILTSPLSSATIGEKVPDVPHPCGDGSPSSVKKSLPILSETSPVAVIMQDTNVMESAAEQPSSGPPQYIPSAAIPVPSVSPAHATNSSDDLELIEAALVPLSRRTHHDFHELEPISEHGEVAVDSPLADVSHEQEDREIEFEPGGYGPESTV